MGTKKWSEIKKLSKATEADRAEARAELEAEIRNASGCWTIQQIADEHRAPPPSAGLETGSNSRRQSRSRKSADVASGSILRQSSEILSTDSRSLRRTRS